MQQIDRPSPVGGQRKFYLFGGNAASDRNHLSIGMNSERETVELQFTGRRKIRDAAVGDFSQFNGERPGRQDFKLESNLCGLQQAVRGRLPGTGEPDGNRVAVVLPVILYSGAKFPGNDESRSSRHFHPDRTNLTVIEQFRISGDFRYNNRLAVHQQFHAGKREIEVGENGIREHRRRKFEFPFNAVFVRPGPTYRFGSMSLNTGKFKLPGKVP